jgi:heme/copper-type cytochrome/quinol oxidase subunit 2
MGAGMAALSLFLCATLAACVALGVQFMYVNLKLRIFNASLDSMISTVLIIFIVIAMFVVSHFYYNVEG